MKNKLIYVLLPLCISVLPACSKSYTLTIVNTDESAGTILTQSGSYKAGELIKIEAELNQGYKISKWVDNVNGKIGSRPSFSYRMPNQNATLTIYYGYAKYNLKVDLEGHETGGRFSISEIEYLMKGMFKMNGVIKYGIEDEITWKDEVNLEFGEFYNGLEKYFDFSGWYDSLGNKLGDTNATFLMPNYDYSVYGNCASHCYAITIKSNEPFWFNSPSINPSVRCCYINGYTYAFLFNDEDNGKYTINLTIEKETGFEFDYWYDLDEKRILSTETSCTFDSIDRVYNLEYHVHAINK